MLNLQIVANLPVKIVLKDKNGMFLSMIHIWQCSLSLKLKDYFDTKKCFLIRETDTQSIGHKNIR